MMAITFENVIFDRIIDNLNSIIANEFGIQIFYDEHQGNQSFLLQPVTDEVLDTLSHGQIREVTVNIQYELDLSNNITKNSFKQVMSITERLKRLLFNNNTYSVSGENQFRNGSVGSVEYEQEDDKIRSITTFTCQTLELVWKLKQTQNIKSYQTIRIISLGHLSTHLRLLEGQEVEIHKDKLPLPKALLKALESKNIKSEDK